jgi:large subunit ribosomal protein L15
MRDTIKKIPKLRGRGKNLNTSHQKVMRVVNIAKLDEIFATGALVSPKTLVENKLVNRDGGKLPTVKILATGETAKKFTVEGCIVSASARAKLEKGGSTIK